MVATLAFAGPTVRNAISKLGNFAAPGSNCTASLRTDPMGGGKSLVVKAGKEKLNLANDVSGIAWLDSSRLVFSVSPVYGKPGLFEYNCTSKEKRTILPPKNITKAYPDGTDFIELQRIVSDGGVIFFYYSPDVDKTDLSFFRTKSYLYSIKEDGSDFKKSK